MAFALGEDRDEHIGARDLFAAGGLHVDRGALDDALEARGRLRLFAGLDDKAVQLVVDVARDGLAERVDVDAAGAHDGGGVGIVDQREQQMFERGEFVSVFVRDGEGAAQRLFQRS